MMPIEKAKKFAEAHFPEGPEKLAAHLKIEVRQSPLVGCDGWVLSGPAGVRIRLNSKFAAVRRRFTLAHELGHLLLGVPTVVGESVYESLKSNSREERRVNDLASELLLPESVVRQYLPAVPVIAAQLRKLAKDAKVSELAAAIRAANLAVKLGLVNASVAFFQDSEFEWQWSKTLTMSRDTAIALLEQAKGCEPQAARIQKRKTNEVIVASMIANLGFGSETLFVQLLPAEVGNQKSKDERRRELEEYLFKNDEQFRMELQGVFGAFRPKCKALDVDAAVATFFTQKGERWEGARRTRLNSARGREYVRLRLGAWCS
jgi:hypothetical protein